MGKAERAKQEAVEGQSEGMFLGLGMQERLPEGIHNNSFNKHLLNTYKMPCIHDIPVNNRSKVLTLLEITVWWGQKGRGTDR